VEENRNAYKILAGKHEGRIPVGKPRRKSDHNIKMDLTEIGLEFVDCIYLTQDRDQWWTLVNTVMILWVP
jgi:hypothetical protein